jgi:hypothetical protein
VLHGPVVPQQTMKSLSGSIKMGVQTARG